jgi:hypothetical protein
VEVFELPIFKFSDSEVVLYNFRPFEAAKVKFDDKSGPVVEHYPGTKHFITTADFEVFTVGTR